MRNPTGNSKRIDGVSHRDSGIVWSALASVLKERVVTLMAGSWPKIAGRPAFAVAMLLLAVSAPRAQNHAGPRYIRNSQGQTLGWIQDDRNEERGYDSEGRLVGWYDKQSDTTLNSEGQLVTTGNSLSDLIVQSSDRNRRAREGR